MDRMLVVVFDSESKAFEGKNALLRQEGDGITVYAHAVLAKHADGTATVEDEDDFGPIGTMLGTSFGILIGLFGGPAGLALGAATGVTAGGAFDLNKSRIGRDFVDDVGKVLTPGKFALVAEIEEHWTTSLDARMEALGGTVFRRALSDVKRTIHEKNVAAMKADLAQMKREHARARADRRARLREKINQLESRIQAQLQKAKDRRQEAKREAQAKVKVLMEKAVAKGRVS